MKKLVGAVALVLVFSAAQSEAATIGTTPANNDVIPGTEGWYGANWFLIAGGLTAFDVEFIGKEAQYTDRFFINNAEVFNNQTATVGQVVTVNIAPGLMTFHFTINGGAPVALNGANPMPSGNVPNYFSTLGDPRDTNINGMTASSGTVLWLALDDGGAGPDDNHDDMVVKLTIKGGGTYQVPDGGATLSLLGCALLGLGALRRRFNA